MLAAPLILIVFLTRKASPASVLWTVALAPLAMVTAVAEAVGAVESVPVIPLVLKKILLEVSELMAARLLPAVSAKRLAGMSRLYQIFVR